ncbi:MAG: hypothetical protein ABIT58_11105 [Ferruginibacter sp.]
MKKSNNNNPGNIKPDLKHDNMEYSASTDGDDILDANDEDEGITAEELDFIESANVDEQAAALNSTEIDRTKDDDIFFDEKDVDEDYETDEEGDSNQQRNEP